MELTIHFESSVPRRVVALHAWEPQGEVWDLTTKADAPEGATSFTFQLTGEVADQRTVQFKYRFPDEKHWESDELIRRVPTRRVHEFWTFDVSSRVTTRDPARREAPATVTFNLLTRARFAGGRLYAWQPGTSETVQAAEAARDVAAGISSFRLPVQPWMRRGFHFKFIDARGQFEDERHNRVWRPGDGPVVYVKTGQVSVRAVPLALRTLDVALVLPRAMAAAAPPLRLRDDSEGNETVVAAEPSPGAAADARFVVAHYRPSVFPRSPYTVSFGDTGLGGAPIVRPVRVAEEDEGAKLSMVALYGDDRWLPAVPATVPIDLVFHPGPWTAPLEDLAFDLGVGDGPAFDRVVAARQSDGTWRMKTMAFPHVRLWTTPVSTATIDRRPDGPATSRRHFTLAGGDPVLHTVDGQMGVAPNPPPLPAPADPPAARPAIMAAAFGSALAGAGIFDPAELPHGATRVGNDVYFVVSAPHAVRLELVLLDPAGLRVVHPMQVTLDNRYWWCARPLAEIPEGQRYRFLQNADTEVLDPASRWVSDPARELWANVGEGGDRAWSRYVDHAALAAAVPSGFNIGFEDLIIYELHPLRYTVRNGVPDGLDQITAELGPGGYLQRLGVTALELLPMHEFSKGSWGYNPSLFFAIDSDFGGPQALARTVAAAHAAGKGVMMDLVFNHVVESPLQALAKDVYVDGDTAWGDEINYDHPLVREFFRQAVLYLWNTFSIDGFRFDSTEAIVNGQWRAAGVINVPGSGGGWDFLGGLRWALRRAADATGRRWPYLVGENDPNNWGMTDNRNGGVLDGQWHFSLHYPLDHASFEDGDDSSGICDSLAVPHIWMRPFSEAVRYAESHDSCGHREDWKTRLARRAPFGRGFRTAKAAGTVALLAHGVPMLFQGQEGGEDEDFFFDYDPAANRADLRFFARLALYEDLGNDRNRIFAWYRDLMGLRNNSANGLRGNDNQVAGRGYRTVAFSRAGGRFFVVATFGTTDVRQNLGWLNLPNGGATYKEIFNSSWPAYRVEGEDNFTNGGYDAVLRSDSVINLPQVGGIVLERR